MNLFGEGTITFRTKGQHDDWSTNDQDYQFPPAGREGIEIQSRKKSDKTVELNVTDQFGNSAAFQEPLPSCDDRGLSVAISWKNQTVDLFLNGRKVASQKLLSH